MKLMENRIFETITSDLAAMENEYRLEARLEMYSCKTGTSDERKAYKSFVSTSASSTPNKAKEYLGPPDSLALYSSSSGSISSTSPRHSVGGNGGQCEANLALCDTINKKTFWYLVATLNASYGMDADFSDVRSQMFSREPSVEWVMDRINTNFTTVVGAEYEKLRPFVWKAIDEQITLRDCTVYSFSPDVSYDPYANEHNLWKFWYLFYNPTLKRVCFFQCRAVKNGTDASAWEEENSFVMEEDAGYYSRTISTA